MGTEVAVGLVMAAVAAAGSYISQSNQAEAQRRQLEYQAAVNRNNAVMAQQQAQQERQKGQIVQENIDRERAQIRRDFERQQGKNVSLLAGGNVDLTSGSALGALEGNVDIFAADIEWNRQQHALAGWEANEKARQLEFQADGYGSQGSFMDSTASSLGPSLLTAGMAGLSSGMSAYSMAGGVFGGGTPKGKGVVPDGKPVGGGVWGSQRVKDNY